MAVLGVGIDVADRRRIEQLIQRSGRRFLVRWFSDRELGQCGSASAALTSRFAAKEAVWKALGLPRDGALAWRLLEVLVDGRGRTEVRFAGWIADEVAQRRISEVFVTTVVHGDIAVAMAVLQGPGANDMAVGKAPVT